MNYKDEDIIQSLKTGENRSVLEHLYSGIYPKIKSYILSNSGSEDDALDIFQDSIIALCKQIRAGKFNRNYEVSAYLYVICKNLWINKAKRDARSISLIEEYDYSDQADFSDSIITKEKERVLKNITAKLGQKCFELLKYSCFYKASSEEIISKMGFSTSNAVKTQKYKCKQKLFKIFEEYPQYKEVVE